MSTPKPHRLSQPGGWNTPLFLSEGDQPITKMADLLAGFIASATTSVHIAIYDFHLKDPATAERVLGALKDQAARGVEVRVAYDHRNAPKFGLGDDPAPHRTHAFLSKEFTGTEVELSAVGSAIASESIAGAKLMHSKYVIRDGHTDRAAVLMGSANFSDDAWTKQDNNVLVFECQPLAAYYETDFNEMWSAKTLVGSGINDFGTVPVGGSNVDVSFSPGEGRRTDREIAELILGAHREIHIATMLITSDTILNALSQVLDDGRVPVTGVYDGPQMAAAKKQMAKSPRSGSKVAQIEQIEQVLVGKKSHAYTENGVHDFLHHKLVVADDVVLTGSHNFSLSATHNAENAVVIHDPAVAKAYRDEVERLVVKYRK